MEQLRGKYVERADELAQEVVNTWGMYTNVGHAKSLTPDFKNLFELAVAYRTATDTAENRRQFNMLSQAEAAKEKATRETFVEAYLEFEKREKEKRGA